MPGTVLVMETSAVDATSLAWMLGGNLPVERMELAPLDGATVTLRRVSDHDQDRWRDERRMRMRGLGALGDDGDLQARSYVYVPIPEWILDCCTTCFEISRSAPLPSGLPDDQLVRAGFAATNTAQLDLGTDALVDLLRLVVPATVQVPVTELILRATVGPYGQRHHAWATPGFLWSNVAERWDLLDDQFAELTLLWRSATNGPNAETIRWPLRRFGVAQRRPFAEDRLVDFAIALETIFIAEADSHRNTSALLVRRANRLLGGEPIATKLRTRRLLDGYQTRSDLVHGRLPPEEAVQAAVANMESVLRESLRLLLSVPDRLEPQLDSLT